MKHNDFYPDNKPQQPEWHSHFATRLIVHGPALPLTTDEVDNAVADNRPLLVATQAEIREYRARFFDDGAPTSGWCAVVKVTVSP